MNYNMNYIAVDQWSTYYLPVNLLILLSNRNLLPCKSNVQSILKLCDQQIYHWKPETKLKTIHNWIHNITD